MWVVQSGAGKNLQQRNFEGPTPPSMGGKLSNRRIGQ